MKQLLRVGTAAGALSLLFVACSQAPNIGGTNGQGASAAAGSGGARGHSGGSGAQDLGSGFTFSTGNMGGDGSGTETCAGQTSKAEVVPLDIYLMLDASGSMKEITAGGASKWDAVTQALSTFFHDSHSAGLMVGIQQFPARTPGVPASCAAHQDCPGTSGPCLLRICAGQASLMACVTAADCPLGAPCIPLGKCGADYCAPANNAPCGGTSIPCSPVTTSVCAHEHSCAPADYAAPLVEIAPLPGAAASLDGAILAIAPKGATPTGPALGGAVEHARSWAAANPNHTVVVVLATDGWPTLCTPLDIPSIAHIAAAGLAGSPSVKTFTIGVFSSADIAGGAQQNLDEIATAGGTTQAFIIDTSQSVEQQFLAALDAIRGTKLACEYGVPPPGDAGPPDFAKVNVEHTPPGAAEPATIGYVGSAMGCDPTSGGWYYDVDPATGSAPTKIIMCPATCDAFGAEIGGQVEIRVGCKTVFAPPPK